MCFLQFPNNRIEKNVSNWFENVRHSSFCLLFSFFHNPFSSSLSSPFLLFFSSFSNNFNLSTFFNQSFRHFPDFFHKFPLIFLCVFQSVFFERSKKGSEKKRREKERNWWKVENWKFNFFLKRKPHCFLLFFQFLSFWIENYW